MTRSPPPRAAATRRTRSRAAPHGRTRRADRRIRCGTWDSPRWNPRARGIHLRSGCRSWPPARNRTETPRGRAPRIPRAARPPLRRSQSGHREPGGLEPQGTQIFDQGPHGRRRVLHKGGMSGTPAQGLDAQGAAAGEEVGVERARPRKLRRQAIEKRRPHPVGRRTRGLLPAPRPDFDPPPLPEAGDDAQLSHGTAPKQSQCRSATLCVTKHFRARRTGQSPPGASAAGEIEPRRAADRIRSRWRCRIKGGQPLRSED